MGGSIVRKIASGLSAVAFLLACFALRAADEIPEVGAALSREEIAVGDETILTVEVSWRESASAIRFELPDPPEVENLEVTGSSQRSVARRRGGGPEHIHSFIFRLKGLKPGEGKVGRVEVTYRRPEEEQSYTLQSPELNVTVSSSWKRIFRSATRVLFFIVLGAVGAALAGLYIAWTVRRSRRRARQLVSEYVRSLEEESLEELKEASRLKVEGDREGFCALLWKVLSGYLEKRFSLKVSDKRWDQLMEEPGLKIMSEDSRLQLAGILQTLERVRFGSYPGGEGDLEALLKKVRNFIEAQTEE